MPCLPSSNAGCAKQRTPVGGVQHVKGRHGAVQVVAVAGVPLLSHHRELLPTQRVQQVEVVHPPPILMLQPLPPVACACRRQSSSESKSTQTPNCHRKHLCCARCQQRCREWRQVLLMLRTAFSTCNRCTRGHYPLRHPTPCWDSGSRSWQLGCRQALCAHTAGSPSTAPPQTSPMAPRLQLTTTAGSATCMRGAVGHRSKHIELRRAGVGHSSHLNLLRPWAASW